MKVTRPPLIYFGGKFKMSAWLHQYFPPHRAFVIPYGGGAGELWQKAPSEVEIYNELNGELTNLFQVLRNPETNAELARLVCLTPYSRPEFNGSYDLPETDDPVNRALRLMIKGYMGYGSSGTSRKYRVGFASTLADEKRIISWTNLPQHFASWLNRLRQVEIDNRPALEVIEYTDAKDTFFYLDPPYVHETRADNSSYIHEMSSEQHRELAAKMHTIKGMALLSGYDGPLYGELYADWHKVMRESFASGRTGEGTVRRTEVLWMNQATVDALACTLF